MVQVYIKDWNENRGDLSSPRMVLSVQIASGTVTIAGSSVKSIHCAVEYVRPAVTENDLALHISRANYQLKESIDYAPVYCDNPIVSLDHLNHENKYDLGVDNNAENPIIRTIDKNNGPTIDRANNPNSHLPLTVVDNFEVYWTDDEQYYLVIGTLRNESGKHDIIYDDGESETKNMATKTWLSISTMRARTAALIKIDSNTPAVLQEILGILGKLPLMLHQAQKFTHYVRFNAFSLEEA